MPKKETKTLISIILFLDIISIGVFLLLYLNTKNLVAESINKENDIKLELIREDGSTMMKEDLALAKKYQEKIHSYIIPKAGTVDFIKVLEEMVSNSGLKSNIKTVVNQAYDKGNSVGTENLKINMDVIGEWKNIQFFLSLLENYPLKIDIQKVSFNKLSDSFISSKKMVSWVGGFEFTVVKFK